MACLFMYVDRVVLKFGFGFCCQALGLLHLLIRPASRGTYLEKEKDPGLVTSFAQEILPSNVSFSWQPEYILELQLRSENPQFHRLPHNISQLAREAPISRMVTGPFLLQDLKGPPANLQEHMAVDQLKGHLNLAGMEGEGQLLGGCCMCLSWKWQIHHF